MNKTVRELVTGNPGANETELDYWMAYDLIQPFGDERKEFMFGVMASMNCHGSKATDFMWDYVRDGEDESKPEAKVEKVLDEWLAKDNVKNAKPQSNN